MEVDLHIHTKYSDGTFSPIEILKMAHKRKMKVISITDHDTIDGVTLGANNAKEYGLEFVKGIEISCNQDGRDVHILGYFLNLEDSFFQKEIKYLQLERERRNSKIIEEFKKYNIFIDMKEIEKISKGNIMGRPHFAHYLVENKYARNMTEAFSKYLGKSGLVYVERENFSPQRAVELIRKNGGLSSLAHPELITEDDNYLEKLIVDLKDKGLAAIECNYSSFTKAESKKYRKLANKHSLLVTGGSDFHGQNQLGVDIGSGGLDYERFLELKSQYKKYL